MDVTVSSTILQVPLSPVLQRCGTKSDEIPVSAIDGFPFLDGKVLDGDQDYDLCKPLVNGNVLIPS